MSTTKTNNTLCLIDSHAHVDMEQFDADREEVIYRAKQSGVNFIINVGIDLASSLKAIELSRQNPSIIAAAGIHPQETGSTSEQDISELSRIARDPHVAAIGEIGLDFYRDHSPHEQQLKFFKRQLSLADELNKPVIIHCRQAEKEMLEVLTEWKANNRSTRESAGVIHCFSGTISAANAYLRLGFCISLGAYIGYPSSKSLHEVIKQLPMDKLLVETDCPFLPPQGKRGERNEPSYVVEAARELAIIKGLSLEAVANHTSENTKRLFGIRG
jgi:TatD DNase family protein